MKIWITPRSFLKSVQGKLNNERFVSNAPQNIVDMERKKEADALSKIEVLEKKISSFLMFVHMQQK